MNCDLHASIRKIVAFSLSEDIGSGDVTANLIDPQRQAEGQIISREKAVICGIPWANEVFRQIDNSINLYWKIKEGNEVKPDQVLCDLSGPAAAILTAERTALNFLQTLSGTATTVKKYADLIKHTRCRILDTRKTIPGLRLAQKHAVVIGGGVNHRIGLYDGVLIKENHITSAGSIESAVKAAQAEHADTILIEVEVESIEQLKQALAAGAKRILLDNFDLNQLEQAIVVNRQRACLEASGNITEENILDVAQTGVDYISLGALTKHVRAIDLSLLFEFSDPSR